MNIIRTFYEQSDAKNSFETVWDEKRDYKSHDTVHLFNPID